MWSVVTFYSFILMCVSCFPILIPEDSFKIQVVASVVRCICLILITGRLSLKSLDRFFSHLWARSSAHRSFFYFLFRSLIPILFFFVVASFYSFTLLFMRKKRTINCLHFYHSLLVTGLLVNLHLVFVFYPLTD